MKVRATTSGTLRAGAIDMRRLAVSLPAATYSADAERCIRCGSCAILAPGVFAVERRVQILRQPEGDAEQAQCRAAAIVCPTGAIRAEGAP
jgi:ferredoxin